MNEDNLNFFIHGWLCFNCIMPTASGVKLPYLGILQFSPLRIKDTEYMKWELQFWRYPNFRIVVVDCGYTFTEWIMCDRVRSEIVEYDRWFKLVSFCRVASCLICPSPHSEEDTDASKDAIRDTWCFNDDAHVQGTRTISRLRFGYSWYLLKLHRPFVCLWKRMQ